jgi:glycerol-3-phosphate acyltransferase PlsY
MTEFALVVIGSYLIGSIPVGLILGKLKGVDVRQYGSGKTGTTNVLRTIGKRYAAIALISDVLKGVVAVLMARYVIGYPMGEMAAAFAAVAGHNWSIYIKFRGGRGVATSVGGAVTMVPIAALVGLVAFAAIVGIFRYVSLGSILGSLSAAIAAVVLAVLDRAAAEHVIFICVAVAFIIFQHHDNISRLLSGRETKLGQKGEKRQPA